MSEIENVSKTPRECINQVQDWLTGYDAMCHDIARMQAEYQAAMAELRCEAAAPIANYGGMPRGGGSELTAVEAVAAHRAAAIRTLSALKAKIDESRQIVSDVNQAFDTLSDIEKKLVKLRFCKQMKWGGIADQLGISTRWACACGYRAIAKMAAIIFTLDPIDVGLRSMRFFRPKYL